MVSAQPGDLCAARRPASSGPQNRRAEQGTSKMLNSSPCAPETVTNKRALDAFDTRFNAATRQAEIRLPSHGSPGVPAGPGEHLPREIQHKPDARRRHDRYDIKLTPGVRGDGFIPPASLPTRRKQPEYPPQKPRRQRRERIDPHFRIGQRTGHRIARRKHAATLLRAE
jgi:hypothetical protein